MAANGQPKHVAPRSAFGRSPRLRRRALALALVVLSCATAPLRAQDAESSAPPAAAVSKQTNPAARRAEQERISKEEGYRLDLTAPGEAETSRRSGREPNFALSLLGVFLRLGVVVGLLYGTLWAIRKLRREPGLRWGSDGQELVCVLESSRLTADKSLHVVSVGSKVLLLASSAQGVHLLSEFDESEFSDAVQRSRGQGGAFASQLEQAEAEYSAYGAPGLETPPPREPVPDSASGSAREAVRRALESLRSSRKGGRAR